jgi:hypothetical protein
MRFLRRIRILHPGPRLLRRRNVKRSYESLKIKVRRKPLLLIICQTSRARKKYAFHGRGRGYSGGSLDRLDKVNSKKGKDKQDVLCYNYDKAGYYKRDYRALKRSAALTLSTLSKN